MAKPSASSPERFCYPAHTSLFLLLFAVFILALVLGGIWLLLTRSNSLLANTSLAGGMILVGVLGWIMFRGGMDRRRFIRCESAGLVFGREGGDDQRLAWEEIREIRHVWLSADPHLAVGVGGSGRIHRIYYQLERASELVAIVARRAKGITNGYALPLNFNRPGPLRAMAVPAVGMSPILAIAVFPLMKRDWVPALIFGGFGVGILAIAYVVHRRQPLTISISESTGIVWREADETRSIALDRVTEMHLELSDREPRRPVLVIGDQQAGRLVVDFGWVDPVRLYALLCTHRSARRTHSEE
jgi:hypothetical protein